MNKADQAFDLAKYFANKNDLDRAARALMLAGHYLRKESAGNDTRDGRNGD